MNGPGACPSEWACPVTRPGSYTVLQTSWTIEGVGAVGKAAGDSSGASSGRTKKPSGQLGYPVLAPVLGFLEDGPDMGH